MSYDPRAFHHAYIGDAALPHAITPSWAMRAAGFRHITITGRQPTLDPALADYLSLARELGYRTIRAWGYGTVTWTFMARTSSRLSRGARAKRTTLEHRAPICEPYGMSRRIATVVALSIALGGCSLYFGDPDDPPPAESDAGTAPPQDALAAQTRCERGEPNNSPPTATPIVTGLLHQLAVCPAGDVDYFAFDIAATDNLHIEVVFENVGGAGDLDIRLYTDTGRMVDLSAGFGNTETIDRSDLEAGTYILEVYGYTALIANDYDLSVVARTP